MNLQRAHVISPPEGWLRNVLPSSDSLRSDKCNRPYAVPAIEISEATVGRYETYPDIQ